MRRFYPPRERASRGGYAPREQPRQLGEALQRGDTWIETLESIEEGTEMAPTA
jgi:hypothetical protein